MKRLFLISLMVILSSALICVGVQQTPAAPATGKPTSAPTPKPAPQYGGVLRSITPLSPKIIGYPPEIVETISGSSLSVLKPWS